jgi:hypothetical protein
MAQQKVGIVDLNLFALSTAAYTLPDSWRQNSRHSLGRKKNHFTLMFEAFAIRVLTAAPSVEEARKLLNMNWHQVEAIKTRAVERCLKRRKSVNIPYVGIDQKQFRSGHRYISSLVDP